jgi:hypothetical protein
MLIHYLAKPNSKFVFHLTKLPFNKLNEETYTACC